MKKIVTTLVMMAALVAPLSATNLPFNNAWNVQKFPLTKGNEYSLGGTSLGITSEDAVSILFRSNDPSNWGATKAGWKWEVSSSVPATNLANKGGDDRNVAMYFVFLPEAEAQQLKGAGIAKVLRNKAAKALVYIHGGSASRGSVLPNPYLAGRGASVILRPSGTGSNSESVDLAGDYNRAFGGEAGVLFGIGISADSDDTNSVIKAKVSNLSIN